MAFNPSASILAGVDNTTLTQWLSEARTAYHQLLTGQKVASAAYDGKSTSFTQADSAGLLMWIGMLQAQLGTVCRPRRALRPYFR